MDILDYLPQKIKTEAALYMRQGLEEIRVRAGQPTQYIMRAGSVCLLYTSRCV